MDEILVLLARFLRNLIAKIEPVFFFMLSFFSPGFILARFGRDYSEAVKILHKSAATFRETNIRGLEMIFFFLSFQAHIGHRLEITKTNMLAIFQWDKNDTKSPHDTSAQDTINSEYNSDKYASFTENDK